MVLDHELRQQIIAERQKIVGELRVARAMKAHMEGEVIRHRPSTPERSKAFFVLEKVKKDIVALEERLDIIDTVLG